VAHARGGATGVLASPQWLHDGAQLNNIIMSGEAIPSAENGGKPLGGRNLAGGAHFTPIGP